MLSLRTLFFPHELHGETNLQPEGNAPFPTWHIDHNLRPNYFPVAIVARERVIPGDVVEEYSPGITRVSLRRRPLSPTLYMYSAYIFCRDYTRASSLSPTIQVIWRGDSRAPPGVLSLSPRAGDILVRWWSLCVMILCRVVMVLVWWREGARECVMVFYGVARDRGVWWWWYYGASVSNTLPRPLV